MFGVSQKLDDFTHQSCGQKPDCFHKISQTREMSAGNMFWRVFCETYQSGTRLPGCFFDRTKERRAGRAPPLYHPHKDRKRERRYLKGHPTHRLKITF